MKSLFLLSIFLPALSFADACPERGAVSPGYKSSSVSCDSQTKQALIQNPKLAIGTTNYNIIGSLNGQYLAHPYYDNLCKNLGFARYASLSFKLIYSYFDNGAVASDGNVQLVRQSSTSGPIGTLICRTSSPRSPNERTVDDMIRQESVSIDTTYNGIPFLAVTGRENSGGKVDIKKIERAKALCQRFGYGDPVSVTVTWSRQEGRLMNLDDKGNIYDIFESRYETSNNIYYYAYFESLRCKK
jgi:hypothetical protein